MRLCELAVGSRLRDKKDNAVFLVAARDHPGYPGVALIADEPVASICYDAAEPDNPLEDRQKNGSNDYALSNIHQWLNASGEGWFHPASPTDRPPEAYIDPMMPPEFAGRVPPCVTDADPGYLTRFSEAWKQALLEAEVSYMRGTAENRYEEARLKARVFVPSQTELGLGLDVEYPDGVCLKLMEDPRMKLCRQGYWTRTPGFRDSDDIVLPYHMRVDKTSGIARAMDGMLYKFYGNKPCCSTQGVRPVMVLSGALELSGPDERGIFSVK